MSGRTAAGAVTLVTMFSGAALAHPGHGVTDPATPLHQLEHLGLMASSPLTWLALVLSGLLVYRLLSHRRHASRRR